MLYQGSRGSINILYGAPEELYTVVYDSLDLLIVVIDGAVSRYPSLRSVEVTKIKIVAVLRTAAAAHRPGSLRTTHMPHK